MWHPAPWATTWVYRLWGKTLWILVTTIPDIYCLALYLCVLTIITRVLCNFTFLRRHSSTFKSFEDMVGSVKVSLLKQRGTYRTQCSNMCIDLFPVWITQDKVTGSPSNNVDSFGFERKSRHRTWDGSSLFFISWKVMKECYVVPLCVWVISDSCINTVLLIEYMKCKRVL